MAYTTKVPIKIVGVSINSVIDLEDLEKIVSNVKLIKKSPPEVDNSKLNHSWDKFTSKGMYDFYSLDIEISKENKDIIYRAVVRGNAKSYLSSKEYINKIE